MIPDCLCDKNITVDLIEKVGSDNIANITSSSCTSRDITSVRYATGCYLRTLLGKSINSKAFYFLTAKSKAAPSGKLNFSDTDSNGDVSYSQLQESTIAPDSKKSCLEEGEDKSVMGSPLKLQIIANLSVTTPGTSTPLSSNPKDRSTSLDTCYISLKEARKILAKFNLASLNGYPASTVVIPCDGEDFHQTVLIGAHKQIQDKKTILKTFRVTSDKVKLSSLEEPTEKTVRGYQITSHYRILDKKDGLGSVTLEARWSDPLGRLKLTKLQAAEFFLHLDIVSGCDRSPVFHHYHQLWKVRGLVEGLATGEVPEVWSQKSVDALKLVKDFFVQVKLGDATTSNLLKGEAGNGTSNAGMLSGTSKQLNLGSPVDSDFTDHLWCILSQCADFSAMVQCLNATFCELRKGDLRVFIHKDNQTTVAKLVRQSYTGMASFPTLSGCLPLRLMAEIGLEKIRKDVLALFVNNGLCTSGQWESFFQSLTLDTNEIMDMEELNIQILGVQSDILSKLHHCLEIVSIIDAFTENQDLGSIAKFVMNYYKSEALDESHCFTIPITALQASPEIKKQPLISARRETERKGESAVVCFQSEMPCGVSMSSDMSTFVEDSKIFYMLKMQEHVLYI